jgi:antitoxin MazE
MAMLKARIIKIGNSQGLRIPRLVLEQLDLKDEVELEIQDKQLIIRPLRARRRGWEEQFQAMAATGDDQLLDEDVPSLSTWDDEEWKW